jgi:hypothetical protein
VVRSAGRRNGHERIAVAVRPVVAAEQHGLVGVEQIEAGSRREPAATTRSLGMNPLASG